MAVLLDWWETTKKDNHINHCHDQQKYFSRFIFSVYGMLWREALVAITQLSQIIEAKIDEHISYVRGWINSEIAIAVSISYLHMIRGALLPSTLRDRDPDWDP